MSRRHGGRPGKTEPADKADLEGPAPADLLQMWITGQQPPTGATPRAPVEPDRADDPVVDDAAWSDAVDVPWTGTDDVTAVVHEPELVAQEAHEPAARTDEDEQARGWASFGHAPTAEDVVERSSRNPWHDVLGETPTPPHLPAEPAKPALLRELDHDEQSPDEVQSEVYDPDATAPWTLEDFDAYVGVTRPNPDPEDAGRHVAAASQAAPERRQRVRGLLARMGLHLQHHGEDGCVGLREVETAESAIESPELAVEPVPEPVPERPPAPVPGPPPGPAPMPEPGPVPGPSPEPQPGPLARSELEPIPDLDREDHPSRWNRKPFDHAGA